MKDTATEHIFSLKQTSELFHVPSSTILYWERKGLLHPKRKENDYRTYSYIDHVDISDIIFYKELGLTLAEIKERNNHPVSELADILYHSKKRVLSHIESLLHTVALIDERLQLINHMLQLKDDGYIEMADSPFYKIIDGFDPAVAETPRLSADLNSYCDYITLSADSGKVSPSCRHPGYIVPARFPQGRVIWSHSPSKWIRFFLMSPSSDPAFNQLNDHLQPHIDHICEVYGVPSCLILNYLLTATPPEESEPHNYYEVYAQIIL